MSFQVTGTLHFADETSQVTATFKKREFVLEIPGTYAEFVKFQLTQDKTSLMDQYSVGDMITVHFNLRGKKYEKNGITSYFNNLDAWRIESGAGSQPAAQKSAPAASKPAASKNEGQQQASKPGNDFSSAEGMSFSDDDDGLPF